MVAQLLCRLWRAEQSEAAAEAAGAAASRVTGPAAREALSSPASSFPELPTGQTHSASASTGSEASVAAAQGLAIQPWATAFEQSALDGSLPQQSDSALNAAAGSLPSQLARAAVQPALRNSSSGAGTAASSSAPGQSGTAASESSAQSSSSQEVPAVTNAALSSASSQLQAAAHGSAAQSPSRHEKAERPAESPCSPADQLLASSAAGPGHDRDQSLPPEPDGVAAPRVRPRPRFAICITGDHSTPVAYGDHSHEPVPFAIGCVRDAVDGLGGPAWVQQVPMGPIASPEVTQPASHETALNDKVTYSSTSLWFACISEKRFVDGATSTL